MKTTIEIGTLVRLNSGGPTMTVVSVEVDPEYHPGQKMAAVVWHDSDPDAGRKRGYYDARCLTRVED